MKDEYICSCVELVSKILSNLKVLVSATTTWSSVMSMTDSSGGVLFSSARRIGRTRTDTFILEHFFLSLERIGVVAARGVVEGNGAVDGSRVVEGTGVGGIEVDGCRVVEGTGIIEGSKVEDMDRESSTFAVLPPVDDFLLELRRLVGVHVRVVGGVRDAVGVRVAEVDVLHSVSSEEEEKGISKLV